MNVSHFHLSHSATLSCTVSHLMSHSYKGTWLLREVHVHVGVWAISDEEN